MKYRVKFTPKAHMSDTAYFMDLEAPSQRKVISFMKEFNLHEEMKQYLDSFEQENLQWTRNHITFDIVGPSNHDDNRFHIFDKKSIAQRMISQSFADGEWESEPGKNMFLMDIKSPLNGSDIQLPPDENIDFYKQIQKGSPIEWAAIDFGTLDDILASIQQVG